MGRVFVGFGVIRGLRSIGGWMPRMGVLPMWMGGEVVDA